MEEFKLLGNKLAANDKETRDKTIKTLKKYLSNKHDMVSFVFFPSFAVGV